MRIWVSSLAKVHDTAAKVKPASAVSLLSPGSFFPLIDGLDPDEHHQVHLHDIREEREGLLAPAEYQIAQLVRFLNGWSPKEPLLVHCWAGVSRSTATAFIAACLHNPAAEEEVIATSLEEASPTAFPNTRIVALADKVMARGGRMTAAAERICADADRQIRAASTLEAEPFFIAASFG